MSKDLFTYLERGTLIQKGTLLKVWDDEHSLNGLYEIDDVEKIGDNYSFSVHPIKLYQNRGADESYSLSDLEDLAFQNLLVVYNRD